MPNLFKPKKFVRLNLVGVDGNAFVILGAFSHAARSQGWSDEDIGKVNKEAMSSDYRHLLHTIQSHCKLK